MIADYGKNLRCYREFANIADMVLAFVERCEKEQLEDGRYDLEQGIFALVQMYRTKPKAGAQMESHRLYCDLQYIVEGKEKIYWEHTDNLTVAEDKTPESDIIFYECGADKGYTLLEKGMFGYYTPTDGHMPCIMAEEPGEIKKIVFKIPVEFMSVS